MPAFPARCCERSVKLASNRTVVPCVAKSTPRQETIHVRCGARPLVLTKMPSTTVDECGRMMRSSQHGATTFPERLLVGNAVSVTAPSRGPCPESVSRDQCRVT